MPSRPSRVCSPVAQICFLCADWSHACLTDTGIVPRRVALRPRCSRACAMIMQAATAAPMGASLFMSMSCHSCHHSCSPRRAGISGEVIDAREMDSSADARSHAVRRPLYDRRSSACETELYGGPASRDGAGWRADRRSAGGGVGPSGLPFALHSSPARVCATVCACSPPPPSLPAPIRHPPPRSGVRYGNRYKRLTYSIVYRVLRAPPCV